MLLKMVKFHSFYGLVVFHCVSNTQTFIHSSLDGHLRLLPYFVARLYFSLAFFPPQETQLSMKIAEKVQQNRKFNTAFEKDNQLYYYQVVRTLGKEADFSSQDYFEDKKE